MKKARLILNSVGFSSEFYDELTYGQAQVNIDVILFYAASRLNFCLPRSDPVLRAPISFSHPLLKV